MSKYVVYSNSDEAIICAVKDEAALLMHYFGCKLGDSENHGMLGRNLDEYDREESQGPPAINSRVKVDTF